MYPAKLASDSREKEVNPGDSEPSFHDRLLKSAVTSLPDRRKRRPGFRVSARAGWPMVLGRLVGQGANFVGGLAIGGGVMLLIGGESLVARPKIMIAAGVAFVFLSILLNLLAMVGPKSEAPAAQG